VQSLHGMAGVPNSRARGGLGRAGLGLISSTASSQPKRLGAGDRSGGRSPYGSSSYGASSSYSGSSSPVARSNGPSGILSRLAVAGSMDRSGASRLPTGGGFGATSSTPTLPSMNVSAAVGRRHDGRPSASGSGNWSLEHSGGGGDSRRPLRHSTLGQAARASSGLSALPRADATSPARISNPGGKRSVSGWNGRNGSRSVADATPKPPSAAATPVAAEEGSAWDKASTASSSAASDAELARLLSRRRELSAAESSLFPAEDCRSASIPSPACEGVKAVAGVSLRGHNPTARKTNQDAMVMVEHASTSSLLVAVFDGHGVQGHDVSGFVARTFVTALLQDPRFVGAGGDLCAALSDCLMSAEAAMLHEPSIDASLSGCTAAAAILRGKKLYAIGVGDSRIVLGGASPLKSGEAWSPATVTAKPVTRDHKPDLPDERKRIVDSGGRVMATRNRLAPHILGPPRVWLKDVPAPGLAMSRSLGDLVAKAAGVISTPDRFTVELDVSSRVLLLASDGLWDFVPNHEAIMGALSAAKDSRRVTELQGGDVDTPHAGATEAQDAARSLMRVARARWLQRTGGSDDITIVCVLMH
jgi:serine/threonine protein phosphatase PrpC